MFESQLYHIVNAIHQPYINPTHRSIESKLLSQFKITHTKNLIKISQSVNLYTYNLLKESFKIYQYYIILWLLQGKTSETN